MIDVSAMSLFTLIYFTKTQLLYCPYFLLGDQALKLPIKITFAILLILQHFDSIEK